MTSKEWSTCKLGNIIELQGGGTPKTSIPEYWNGSIPWISVKDFNNDAKKIYTTEKTITELGLSKSATKLLQKGDIIISARGTVGEIAVISKPMAFNQSCYGIKAIPNIVHDDFLYYLLKNSIQYLKHNTHGSVFDTITKETFDKIDILLPPLETQEKIAKVLSSLDDKIELNNKINQNLEQQAQAIFKSWFVDFEPFGGKMPEDWEKSNLLEIANYLNGLAMQKYRPKENELYIPVLKIKELRQGFCDNTSDICTENINDAYIVNNGDIIFSWSGSLLVDIWCGGKCGLNQHLFKVTSEKYDKWFYYFWTKHHLSKFVALASDMATTMGHIKREELQKSEVIIPNKEDYQKINNIIDPILNLIINNKIQNKQLTQLRDTLLPKLMSGEIDTNKIGDHIT